MLRAAAPLVAARAGAVGHLDAVAVDVGGCHRDHQQFDVEEVWKLMCHVVEDVKIVVGLHVALVLSLRRARRHGPAEGNR